MKDRTKAKERFLRDPLPRRLGGIAASLARISSSARRESGQESVEEMIREVKYYIEWTAAETEPEIAAELVNIQVALALWGSGWKETGKLHHPRSILSFQAKLWSERVLQLSGLLPT